VWPEPRDPLDVTGHFDSGFGNVASERRSGERKRAALAVIGICSAVEPNERTPAGSREFGELAFRSAVLEELGHRRASARSGHRRAESRRSVPDVRAVDDCRPAIRALPKLSFSLTNDAHELSAVCRTDGRSSLQLPFPFGDEAFHGAG
jgi:hypothetical protein